MGTLKMDTTQNEQVHGTGSNLSMKGELDKAKNNLKYMSIVSIVYGCALFTVGFINLVAADSATKFEDRSLLSFSAPIQIVLGGMALLAALMNSSAEGLNYGVFVVCIIDVFLTELTYRFLFHDLENNDGQKAVAFTIYLHCGMLFLASFINLLLYFFVAVYNEKATLLKNQESRTRLTAQLDAPSS